MFIEKTFIGLCFMTLLVCLYIINTYNHINSLVLFYLSTILFYWYTASINNNWTRLIILLWYARSITILFYLIADEVSSSYMHLKRKPNIIKNGLVFLQKNNKKNYHYKLIISKNYQEILLRLVISIFMMIYLLVFYYKYKYYNYSSNLTNIKIFNNYYNKGYSTTSIYKEPTIDNFETNSVNIWQHTSEFKPNIDYETMYTNFTYIYNSIISTPSSLFLVLFLLPLFLYVIYFVCNYLSYRVKK